MFKNLKTKILSTLTALGALAQLAADGIGTDDAMPAFTIVAGLFTIWAARHAIAKVQDKADLLLEQKPSPIPLAKQGAAVDKMQEKK